MVVAVPLTGLNALDPYSVNAVLKTGIFHSAYEDFGHFDDVFLLDTVEVRTPIVPQRFARKATVYATRSYCLLHAKQ
jgi:hypothetical protein